jgi:hypothetical protein
MPEHDTASIQEGVTESLVDRLVAACAELATAAAPVSSELRDDRARRVARHAVAEALREKIANGALDCYGAVPPDALHAEIGKIADGLEAAALLAVKGTAGVDAATTAGAMAQEVAGQPSGEEAPPASLTAKERWILAQLRGAFDDFTALDRHHQDDCRDFADEIHTAQRIVLARVARRCNPEVLR